MFFRCAAKSVVTLFATPLLHCLVDGNRALRARFPVLDVDNAWLSLRRDDPSFSLRRLDFRFASELACRSRVAHNREPVLSEDKPYCEPFERDYRLISDARTQNAWTEISSHLASHRISHAEFRRLARSSERAAVLLVSCCLAQRSRGFASPGSRCAFGRALFHFSF